MVQEPQKPPPQSIDIYITQFVTHITSMHFIIKKYNFTQEHEC
jgi:hypothetical protein